MAHAQNSITINRPSADVFAYLADGLNNPNWRAGVVSIQLKSGQAGTVGAEYAQVLKGPGGRNVEGDYRITVADPGKELSFVVTTGPARPTGNYFFEATSDATRVNFVLDFEPRGLAKLMGPMIQKTMESEVAQLSSLKLKLESTS